MSSSENSSRTTNSAGSGSRSAPAARAFSYSETLAKLPAWRSTSWRRFISPASASFIRSTRSASTSTRLSWSGECVASRLSTNVRRNSDLPEPVAPMHRPCGPMPFSAASLMSSSMGRPSAPTPNGTRSRSRP
ncbi:Uncharacterised protein [Mycobacteroides abscessus subsp. abscessus]|nr:Uncharacterised protein [Mycobacteroides abscessus subsp. abscessus]